MAFENPLKTKEIPDAQKEQSRKLNTIQKIEDLRFWGTLLHDNELQKRKEIRKISPTA